MPKRSTFFHHLHPPTIPEREARFRYTFGLGGIAFFLFCVLVLTGGLELLYYVPSADGANKSVQAMTYLVPYGWLVRGVHYWSAQGLVVVAGLHLLRVVFTGAYKRPRRFNWLLGVSLFVFVLLLDFTGYALRWDTDIEWALLVGTNLLKTIPGIGPAFYGLVVGGSEISGDTIVRFFGWHIFGLMLLAVAVVGWHIFRVRRDGGISSRPKTELPATAVRISRNELVKREAFVALLVTIGLLGLTLLSPPSLGPVGDFLQLPGEARAPWFFIWVQQLLRWGDPFVMGILIPIGVLGLIVVVPFVLDRHSIGAARWFNREGRIAQIVVAAIAIAVSVLTIAGIR